jgi:ABC-2 type transport system permease protein
VFELRNYYNPERRSAVQIVPALIGVILTMTMVLFTAVAIVRERERGNLEFLITTPVGTLELMLGKLLPYVLIGLLQVTIVLLVGHCCSACRSAASSPTSTWPRWCSSPPAWRSAC